MIRLVSSHAPARIRIKVQNCHDGRTVMCRPTGNLDRYSFADFAAQVTSLIRPHMHLVFDLVELGFIDSTGVSALLASARRVRRRGGRVSVCNASAHVADLLARAGMDTVGARSRRREGVVPWPQPVS